MHMLLHCFTFTISLPLVLFAFLYALNLHWLNPFHLFDICNCHAFFQDDVKEVFGSLDGFDSVVLHAGSRGDGTQIAWVGMRPLKSHNISILIAIFTHCKVTEFSINVFFSSFLLCYCDNSYMMNIGHLIWFELMNYLVHMFWNKFYV